MSSNSRYRYRFIIGLAFLLFSNVALANKNCWPDVWRYIWYKFRLKDPDTLQQSIGEVNRDIQRLKKEGGHKVTLSRALYLVTSVNIENALKVDDGEAIAAEYRELTILIEEAYHLILKNRKTIAALRKQIKTLERTVGMDKAREKMIKDIESKIRSLEIENHTQAYKAHMAMNEYEAVRKTLENAKKRGEMAERLKDKLQRKMRESKEFKSDFKGFKRELSEFMMAGMKAQELLQEAQTYLLENQEVIEKGHMADSFAQAVQGKKRNSPEYRAALAQLRDFLAARGGPSLRGLKADEVNAIVSELRQARDEVNKVGDAVARFRKRIAKHEATDSAYQAAEREFREELAKLQEKELADLTPEQLLAKLDEMINAGKVADRAIYKLRTHFTLSQWIRGLEEKSGYTEDDRGWMLRLLQPEQYDSYVNDAGQTVYYLKTPTLAEIYRLLDNYPRAKFRALRKERNLEAILAYISKLPDTKLYIKLDRYLAALPREYMGLAPLIRSLVDELHRDHLKHRHYINIARLAYKDGHTEQKYRELVKLNAETNNEVLLTLARLQPDFGDFFNEMLAEAKRQKELEDARGAGEAIANDFYNALVAAKDEAGKLGYMSGYDVPKYRTLYKRIFSFLAIRGAVIGSVGGILKFLYTLFGSGEEGEDEDLQQSKIKDALDSISSVNTMGR